MTGNCTSCHTGASSAIVGKPAKHIITSRPCETCHVKSTWTAVTFQHSSARFPAGHTAKLACTSCHTTGSEALAASNPAFTGTCAACHATAYKPERHVKSLAPAPQFYTLSDLRDCAGACHIYADPTQRVIKTRRNAYHRASGTAF